MRRTAAVVCFAILAGFALISCGSYSSPSSSRSGSTSGLKFRAFVSNPLTTVGGINLPALEIIDATKDVLASHFINLSSVSPQPGMMVVSADKKITLVYSASNNSVAFVDNALESPVKGSSGNPVTPITLPDFSESMVISADNGQAYAAVRNAPVTGQPPGLVTVLSLSTASISDRLPIPNVHWLAQSHNANRILAFGDNQDTVTVIIPSNIGTNEDATVTVCQDGIPVTDPSLCDLNAPKVFDHPVWGVFDSSDNTAYILSCGPECGGANAMLTVLDLTKVDPTTGQPATTGSIPLAAATTGFLNGNALYVAGTPPNTACGSGTAATSCGTIQSVDVTSLTASAPLLITDGYHHHMEMSRNGQLFVGARACTDINISGGEVRGCLSVFNTATSAVVIPPETGDISGVTGIQPITDRNVVYVIEGGELHIYDTTTDTLQATQIDLIGQAVDVKLVDF